MKYTEVVADRIQKLLDKKGLSREELAKRSGVSKSTISKILDTRNVKPQLSTIFSLCKGFNIRISEFYSDSRFDTSI